MLNVMQSKFQRLKLLHTVSPDPILGIGVGGVTLGSTIIIYQKIPPKNQPNIYFVKAWPHWLGMAKPKNVFRSTLNL